MTTLLEQAHEAVSEAAHSFDHADSIAASIRSRRGPLVLVGLLLVTAAVAAIAGRARLVSAAG